MRSTTIISLPAISILLLSGCSGNSGQDRIEFETFSYDRTMLSDSPDSIPEDEGGNPYAILSGQGVLPAPSKDKNVTLLRDSLMRLCGITPDDDRGYRPVPNPEFRLKETQATPDTIEPCSQFTDNLGIVMLTPRTAVWEDYAYSYFCGAAHGNYGYSYVNVDLDGYRMVALADLMKPGYEATLTEILRSRLSERDDLLEDPEEIGIPAQYRITPDGLQFVYGLYEIVPYSSGIVRVDLSAYEISTLLSDYGKKLLLN